MDPDQLAKALVKLIQTKVPKCPSGKPLGGFNFTKDPKESIFVENDRISFMVSHKKPFGSVEDLIDRIRNRCQDEEDLRNLFEPLLYGIHESADQLKLEINLMIDNMVDRVTKQLASSQFATDFVGMFQDGQFDNQETLTNNLEKLVRYLAKPCKNHMIGLDKVEIVINELKSSIQSCVDFSAGRMINTARPINRQMKYLKQLRNALPDDMCICGRGIVPHPSENFYYIVSRDGTVQCRKEEDDSLSWKVKLDLGNLKSGHVNSISINPSGTLLAASGASNQKVFILDFYGKVLRPLMIQHEDSKEVWRTVWTSDKEILVGYNTFALSKHNVDTGELNGIEVLDPKLQGIESLTPLASGNLAIGTVNGHVALLNSGLKSLWTLFGIHKDRVGSIKANKAGSHILTASLDQTVKFINVTKKQVIWSANMGCKVDEVALSHSEKYVAVTDWDYRISLLSAETGFIGFTSSKLENAARSVMASRTRKDAFVSSIADKIVIFGAEKINK